MRTQFMVIDDGKETDWIDPVQGVRTTDAAWFVDNGFHEYEIPKQPGRGIQMRHVSEGEK